MERDIGPCEVADLKLDKWYHDNDGYFRRIRGPKFQYRKHDGSWYIHVQHIELVDILEDLRPALRLEIYLYGLYNISKKFGELI